MIELIFVIVILGMLSAIALPKMIATRDDARISAISSDVMTAVSDIATHSVAFNLENNLSLMSNIIKDYERKGFAKITLGDETATPPVNPKVDILVGTVSNCIILSVIDQDSNGDGDMDTKIISTSYGSTGDTGLCANLQTVVKEKLYPVKLEGKGVKY